MKRQIAWLLIALLLLAALPIGTIADETVYSQGYLLYRIEDGGITICGYVGDDDITFHTLIVPADKADQYKSLQDFVGKHIIAQASSLQQMYVEDQILALGPAGKAA